MKICDFPVLGRNSIDLALVFIRVGAKCGNDDFVLKSSRASWFHAVFLFFQLFQALYAILRGFHIKTHLETYAVANGFLYNYQTTVAF